MKSGKRFKTQLGAGCYSWGSVGDSMTLNFTFDFGAMKAALLYLASKHLPNFDKYRALKLLFLADREHLLRFGRPITGDSYNALPFGPTPAATHKLLDGLESVTIEGDDTEDPKVLELVKSLCVGEIPYPVYQPREAPDMDALSETDLIVLDHVAAEHGSKEFKQLKDLTHEMAAYKRAWRDDQNRKRFAMKFEDFFVETPDRLDLLADIKEKHLLEEIFPDTTCA